MLEIINLEFEYHEKRLLKDIHFTLEQGGLLHIRGKNGIGKTTLLGLIAGLFEPDFGGIYLDGNNIQDDKKTWQEQVCFIGHKSGIHPNLTVMESLYFDLHSQNSFKEIQNIITDSGLKDIANQRCGTLSSGQKRRIALMRLSISKAKIWLLDEPLVALDDSMVCWFVQLIEAHRKQGGYVILTSHQALTGFHDYQELWL